MQIQQINDTLHIHGLSELSAATARPFREEFCSALNPGLKIIEIDLAQTSVVDSGGLGALVSLYRAANDARPSGGVRVRLLNPQPPVLQLLELTRLHHLFEIVAPPGRPEHQPPDAPAPQASPEQRPVPAPVVEPKLQST